MNETRLRHVIKTLERVERMKLPFDMKNWIQSDRRPNLLKFSHNCETSACAIGWEASTKYAQNRGLFLSPLSGIPKYKIDEETFITAWEAIAAYFDISYHLAADLFDDVDVDDITLTLRDVIHNIEQVIANES